MVQVEVKQARGVCDFGGFLGFTTVFSESHPSRAQQGMLPFAQPNVMSEMYIPLNVCNHQLADCKPANLYADWQAQDLPWFCKNCLNFGGFLRRTSTAGCEDGKTKPRFAGDISKLATLSRAPTACILPHLQLPYALLFAIFTTSKFFCV